MGEIDELVPASTIDNLFAVPGFVHVNLVQCLIDKKIKSQSLHYSYGYVLFAWW